MKRVRAVSHAGLCARADDLAPLESVNLTESAGTKSAGSGNHSDSQSPCAAVGYFIDSVGRQRPAKQHHSLKPGEVVRHHRSRPARHDRRNDADWTHRLARSFRTLHAPDSDPATLLRSRHQYSLLTRNTGAERFNSDPPALQLEPAISSRGEFTGADPEVSEPSSGMTSG